MSADWTSSLGAFSLLPEVVAVTGVERKSLAMVRCRCALAGSDCSGDVVYNDTLHLPLCWLHDNAISEIGGAVDSCMQWLAHAWGRAYIISVACGLAGIDKALVQPSTVIVWAIMNNLSSSLPPALITAATKVQNAPKSKRGGLGDKMTFAAMQDCQIERVRQRFSEHKELLSLQVDDECWSLYQARPKLKRWESRKYLNAVKTLPCVVCDCPSDDPHHLIGHGQGKMGGTAHDFFAIPLCRQHHNDLHHDRGNWERLHGSQLEHVMATQNTLFALGVVS